MIQKPLRSKKAISPILATLLLIVIVVAASIVAYVWVQSATESQMSIAGGFIVIENARFYDTNKIDVTIRNTGTSNLKVDTVYIDDVTHPVDRNIQSKGSTVITLEYSWSSGTKCKIKVASTSGLYAEGSYSTPAASTIWYDQSWTKRKTVTIDNTANSDDLINYQVRVNVQYDSNMKADFSDLRFTDADSPTLVSHWVESYVPSDSAVVWVKVPLILGSSEKTVYMYYGNPSASSTSDSDDTFELFLDFTRDGAISYGGSQDTDSTQWQIIDDSTLRMWGNNWKASMRSLQVAGDGSQAICFDFKSDGTQAEINGIGLDTDADLSINWFYRIYGTQNWGINDHYGYTGGDWQFYTLVLNDFSGDFDRLFFSNDADASQATNVYYRNVRVVQYTPQQPSIQVGTEESV